MKFGALPNVCTGCGYKFREGDGDRDSNRYRRQFAWISAFSGICAMAAMWFLAKVPRLGLLIWPTLFGVVAVVLGLMARRGVPAALARSSLRNVRTWRDPTVAPIALGSLGLLFGVLVLVAIAVLFGVFAS
jgi:hypothetical protein